MEHYLAFISYRHIRPDQHVSALLRKHLENWHLPSSCPVSGKRRVFRDTDELPTSTDLGNDIDRALKNSDWLIAVCSEAYVTSRWCMREIDVFIESGRKDRILPVLISGTPETAIPPQLRGTAPVLDLRESSGGIPGSEPGRKLRKDLYGKIPALMEAMTGTKAADTAASERRFRNAVRFGTLAATAAVLLGLGFYTARTADRIAENNREIARATEEAREAEQDALARRDEAFLGKAALLARKAQAAIDEGDDLTAIRLSLEALPEDPESGLPVSLKAVSTLRTALIMPDKQRNTYHPAEPEELVENAQPFNMQLFSAIGSGFEKQMREQGYTGFLSDDFTVCVAYESGKPLATFMGSSPAYAWVDDNTFPAKRAWGINNKNRSFAAWDGEKLAMLRDGDYVFSFILPKFVIPMEEEPQKVDFYTDGMLAAVLEQNGSLTLYRFSDGETVLKAEGTFRDFVFTEENYLMYTLSADGKIRLMNAVTGRILAEMKTPSPVRSFSGNLVRGKLLALCEDCVAILDQTDGDLLYRLPVTGDAVKAEWTGLMDGSGFTVTYEDHEDLYALDTAEQMDSRVSAALATGRTAGSCYHAGYSSDGAWAYVEDLNGNLSKWDTRTGEMIWLSPCEWSEPPSNRKYCPLSADESAIWRQHTDFKNKRLEKVDAETGEVLYRTNWGKNDLDFGRVLEWPDRHLGLVLSTDDDHKPVMFDTQTGRIRWEREEGYGYTAASEDGTTLICLRAETADGLSYGEWKDSLRAGGEEPTRKEEEEKFQAVDMNLTRCTLSVETGEIMDRQKLANLGLGIKGGFEAFDDSGMLVLAEKRWTVNLRTGEVTECDPETVEAFLQAKETPRTACTFDGQSAWIEKNGKTTRLVSDSDGTVLLDAGNRNLAVSPDGGSMILYGKEFSPILIWAADADTLTEEGRKQLAAAQ